MIFNDLSWVPVPLHTQGFTLGTTLHRSKIMASTAPAGVHRTQADVLWIGRGLPRHARG